MVELFLPIWLYFGKISDISGICGGIICAIMVVFWVVFTVVFGPLLHGGILDKQVGILGKCSHLGSLGFIWET